MKQQLEEIRQSAKSQLSKAASLAELDALRVKYLGKKGELTAILKQMGKLTAEERPVIGQLANEIRSDLEASIAESVEDIKQKLLSEKLKAEKIDVTLPAKKQALGHKHPLSIVLDEVKDIFFGMG
ncbi:MAG: phenylalanine--tRNA ligase subunit alpha, partial [Acutalibacteraceae bacterium]